MRAPQFRSLSEALTHARLPRDPTRTPSRENPIVPPLRDPAGAIRWKGMDPEQERRGHEKKISLPQQVKGIPRGSLRMERMLEHLFGEQRIELLRQWLVTNVILRTPSCPISL